MTNKTKSNSNGINISDSIIMSVKIKRRNYRTIQSVFIALCGFVSVIMSFLGMFTLRFDHSKFVLAAVAFSAFYILLVLLNGKALWLYAASSIIFAVCAYSRIEKITEGFKFVYNAIYKKSFNTDVNYYKYVEPKDEKAAVTMLLIFTVWLLAIVLYYFTIYRPNPILPLLVTFPIIEVGLYNGVRIPVFWGMLVVAYWLALLSMSTIDVGEYAGGTGGFVRKDNTFFPKRQMKLKVTEKCGIFVIATVMLITGISAAAMKLTKYERSDRINEKRRNISEAFSEFTMSDFAASISRVTEAFGLKIKKDNNKLGGKDHVTFDNVTDLIVTFRDPCDGAVYLKSDVDSVYRNNEWKKLSKDVYDSPLFDNFRASGCYPQDLYGAFAQALYPDRPANGISIVKCIDDDQYFAPYGVISNHYLTYNDDLTEYDIADGKSSYEFNYVSSSDVIAGVGYVNDDRISPYVDESHKSAAEWYGGYDALLEFSDSTDYYEGIEKSYRQFVYENYLQLPENRAMDEIREKYADILALSDKRDISTIDKIDILKKLRTRISADNTYTLSPGRTPSNRDFANYFLLESHKGYCVHYATAGVLLARMAGIPARYASGYVIVADDFDTAAHDERGYRIIEVKDSRSHAWAEVYLDGFGWVPFEFTAGYSERSVNGLSGNSSPTGNNEPTDTSSATAAVTTTSSTATTTAPQRMSGTTTTSPQTVTTAASTGIAPSKNVRSGGSGGIPKAVRNIIIIISVIALIAAGIILRRLLILKYRNKKFTQGSTRDRIANMYRYCERLLAQVNITNDCLGYKDFAQNAEKLAGGTYFPEGAFNSFMDIALSSAFSSSQPEETKLASCLEFVSDFAVNIYKRSGALRKLSLKYLTVLI